MKGRGLNGLHYLQGGFFCVHIFQGYDGRTENNQIEIVDRWFYYCITTSYTFNLGRVAYVYIKGLYIPMSYVYQIKINYYSF